MSGAVSFLIRTPHNEVLLFVCIVANHFTFPSVNPVATYCTAFCLPSLFQGMTFGLWSPISPQFTDAHTPAVINGSRREAKGTDCQTDITIAQ